MQGKEKPSLSCSYSKRGREDHLKCHAEMIAYSSKKNQEIENWILTIE